jgi:hypothetical protein
MFHRFHCDKNNRERIERPKPGHTKYFIKNAGAAAKLSLNLTSPRSPRKLAFHFAEAGGIQPKAAAGPAE